MHTGSTFYYTETTLKIKAFSEGGNNINFFVRKCTAPRIFEVKGENDENNY